MTREGQVSSSILARKLSHLAPAAFVLGTEVPPEAFAEYSLSAGAGRLAELQSAGTSGSASGKQRASSARSGSSLAHASHRGLAPLELALASLHGHILLQFPQSTLCRWQEWRLDTPASPRLPADAGCGMAQRFLQHYVDSQKDK